MATVAGAGAATVIEQPPTTTALYRVMQGIVDAENDYDVFRFRHEQPLTAVVVNLQHKFNLILFERDKIARLDAAGGSLATRETHLCLCLPLSIDSLSDSLSLSLCLSLCLSLSRSRTHIHAYMSNQNQAPALIISSSA